MPTPRPTLDDTFTQDKEHNAKKKTKPTKLQVLMGYFLSFINLQD